MIKSPDEALEQFEELRNTEWKNLSEADTRSKLIDPIFLQCLNWDEGDITREENVNSIGYVDYYFKIGDRVLFILEAKKEGISFDGHVHLFLLADLVVWGPANKISLYSPCFDVYCTDCSAEKLILCFKNGYHNGFSL